MNRRSFMKKVGVVLAGAIAFVLPSAKPKRIYKFNPGEINPNIANIDPNSKWAKWTKQRFDESILDMPQRTRLEFKSGELSPLLQSRYDMNKYNSGRILWGYRDKDLI